MRADAALAADQAAALLLQQDTPKILVCASRRLQAGAGARWVRAGRCGEQHSLPQVPLPAVVFGPFITDYLSLANFSNVYWVPALVYIRWDHWMQLRWQ